MNRIIDAFTGPEKGTLVIVFGAMHGNEPAGVRALEAIFALLKTNMRHNSHFFFRGKLLGLIGNLRAFKEGKRFHAKDLNRQWFPNNIAKIQRLPKHDLDSEDREIKEILAIIDQEIKNYQPEKVVILDLHTASAPGGIFTIPTDDDESVNLAMALHAPILKGLLNQLNGTSLHFFTTEQLGVPTIALCFESGQHDEPDAVNRAISAIINCLIFVGCLHSEDMQSEHEAISRSYYMGLPRVTELFFRHAIQPHDHFKMKEGYRNFQPVRKGEVLAYDKNGRICAIDNGLIVMPLYQKQGNDGFFLVKSIDVEGLSQ